MMYAMGVGFSAPYISCTRHWLPCYDLPDDKPDSVTLSFYADTSGIVVSNGIRTAYLVANDGYTTYCRWKIAHPIATYLFTFAFGHLEKLSIANPLNIPFDVYALAQDTAKARLAMSAKVVPARVYFDSLFGSYPFEKVGYVIANLGSMEHQTMITLIRQALDTTGTTPQHELSHMWWGDWVTCKDFNDPWLNEGFATFCESLVLERFKGKAQYIARQKQNINGAINGGSTVPLYGTPMTTHTTSNYPSPILYQKGAAVLGMLRYFIGDEKFFDAIRKYGDRHAYSTATSFDLWHDFEEFTGNDLGWFFKKWVFGIGYPQLGVKWSRDGGNITVFLEQKQDPVTIGYFRLPLTIEVRTKTGNKARTVVQLDSIQSTRTSFTVPFTPDTIVIDPDGLVMKKIIGQVQLGVQDATPSYPQYPPYALRITPNPATQRRIRIEFTREAFVHDTKQHPANFDPFYWVFAVPGASVEFYFFDSAGNKVLQTDTRSPGAHKHLFDCDLSGLSNGSYTVVAVNGSQIMAQGRFTLTK
jgi:aminopeptidase N